MITVTIKLSRPKDIKALFQNATGDADRHGITWSGDTRQGYATGRNFEGRYTVDADNITIEVLKKPAYITKKRIEKAIRDYINEIS